MTTPSTDRLVTTSFNRVLTPAMVTAVMNELVTGAPFSGSLTRATTSTGKLAFPVVAPSGYAWLAELEQVPTLVLNDRAVIVSVCKLIAALPVSSEMVADSTVNITSWISGALRDSLSRDLDLGVLSGSGDREPDGVLDQTGSVSGPTLTAAAATAIAEIGEAGGAADTIALSPTAYAAEMAREASDGQMVHPGGLDTLLGLGIVQVPALAGPLCYDSRRCFLVLGQDSTVTLHDDWTRDAQVLLVKARAAVGVPVAAQAIRKLEIGNGASGQSASAHTATAKTATAKGKTA